MKIRLQSFCEIFFDFKQSTEIIKKNSSLTDSSTKPFFIIPTANGDHVICFACGIGVKNWNCECDPWEEHLRYKPKCPFLRVGSNAYKQEKKVRKIKSFHRNVSHVYSEYTYLGSLYHRSKNS